MRTRTTATLRNWIRRTGSPAFATLRGFRGARTLLTAPRARPVDVTSRRTIRGAEDDDPRWAAVAGFFRGADPVRGLSITRGAAILRDGWVVRGVAALRGVSLVRDDAALRGALRPDDGVAVDCFAGVDRELAARGAADLGAADLEPAGLLAADREPADVPAADFDAADFEAADLGSPDFAAAERGLDADVRDPP